MPQQLSPSSPYPSLLVEKYLHSAQLPQAHKHLLLALINRREHNLFHIHQNQQQHCMSCPSPQPHRHNTSPQNIKTPNFQAFLQQYVLQTCPPPTYITHQTPTTDLLNS